MTKKHFIELADVLRKPGMMPAAVCSAINDACGELTLDQKHALQPAIMKAITAELADFCKSQNSQFDRERWLNYIAGTHGINGGKL